MQNDQRGRALASPSGFDYCADALIYAVEGQTKSGGSWSASVQRMMILLAY
jgi:hypothetical protein